MISSIRHYWAILSFGILLLATTGVYFNGTSNANRWFLETTGQAGFVLSNLEIEGIERTKEAEILARLDVDDGLPLLGIDLLEIQARIEALPWIKSANVTRVLPGDLKIQVIERKPYALWQHSGKVRLIDEDGVIITNRGLVEFSDLMLVVGNGGPSETGGLFEMLRSNSALFDRVRTAIRVGERRWDLVFDNGVRVKLPEDIAVQYNGTGAWERFVRLQQKHRLLEREVSVIDMRMKDRVVMRVTPTGRRQMDGKEWST
ncbi:MAG: cell division protein FtsQ/DivIB [Kordiimonas sp.]